VQERVKTATDKLPGRLSIRLVRFEECTQRRTILFVLVEPLRGRNGRGLPCGANLRPQMKTRWFDGSLERLTVAQVERLN
jgi:hypothetical protein